MSRILIVDDDPHLRELARTFLRNAGFEVIEAADGIEALARLEETRADLVILDVMMPRM
ncbi:MAG: response regulator, partial [Chloroflexota bacterium]